MGFMRKETSEEKGRERERERVPTGADTRLITPYTSYLLPGFQ